MKKRWLLIFVFLISFFSYYFTDFDLNNFTGLVILDSKITNPTTSFVKDSGDIQVFFCPRDNCEQTLVNFIDSAQTSIHCALFDIGLESVKKVLDQKEKEIEVKIITDNDYIKKYNRSFVRIDSYSLMHNKFCVIDGKKISTGSMNPTDNGAFKNNNNLLLINSTVLATNYEAEFWEMWNGTFKKGNKVLNPIIDLNGITIKNFFCPEDSCADQIKAELKKAQKSIHFMIFSFTHDGIANILLLKNQAGIKLRGVMEARQISTYSKYEVLKYQGIDVLKDGNSNNLHHKVFIIDNRTVITGSFNPSKNGDTRNDENVLIIEDERLAQKFLDEFEKVYSEAQI